MTKSRGALLSPIRAPLFGITVVLPVNVVKWKCEFSLRFSKNILSCSLMLASANLLKDACFVEANAFDASNRPLTATGTFAR